MTLDPNDVVQVFSGPLETVEAYHATLTEAGIDARVVGTALTSVFGGAIPDTNELWVHRKDLEKATAAIEMYESKKGEESDPPFPHPVSSPKPEQGPGRKEPYVNPDPKG